ncbi:MAG: prepilin-type N-terminal cleavage/methylation domain-containing protein [Verrucomicrobiae bacterium]|nr:prepilin-type N-terminal cleavage/methylation domain-containing protein [Verrucomicrobiae bacterium]MDW8308525.1 prepilin-type N-terminal cleavage/methylation domain-containing protein [Verrucomicrobiales bacterium]
MKPPREKERRGGRRHAATAFTLPEVVVVMALFSLLLTALITTQLVGLKMHRISETKLTATSEGREALTVLRDEIRSAKMLYVGNGNASSFVAITNNQAHIGNALQIWPTTNLARFVRYYVDANTRTLMRFTNGQATPVAGFVTNTLAFRAEDFRGRVLTNTQNHRVIRLTLEFYQWQFPLATAGQGGMYDYYRLQTRVTRRAIE